MSGVHGLEARATKRAAQPQPFDCALCELCGKKQYTALWRYLAVIYADIVNQAGPESANGEGFAGTKIETCI